MYWYTTGYIDGILKEFSLCFNLITLYSGYATFLFLIDDNIDKSHKSIIYLFLGDSIYGDFLKDPPFNSVTIQINLTTILK